ncbi:MAG TPA: hypothetical protein VGS80_17100, partial [Ktedonobacterales bacterium]|nr:hypothetical protein [Ktedonobacterales bacterium]
MSEAALEGRRQREAQIKDRHEGERERAVTEAPVSLEEFGGEPEEGPAAEAPSARVAREGAEQAAISTEEPENEPVASEAP